MTSSLETQGRFCMKYRHTYFMIYVLCMCSGGIYRIKLKNFAYIYEPIFWHAISMYTFSFLYKILVYRGFNFIVITHVIQVCDELVHPSRCSISLFQDESPPSMIWDSLPTRSMDGYLLQNDQIDMYIDHFLQHIDCSYIFNMVSCLLAHILVIYCRL